MPRLGQPPERRKTLPPQTLGTGAYLGEVSRGAGSPTGYVDVMIDQLGPFPYEGCPFTPITVPGEPTIVLLPAVGDLAWVMLDDKGSGVVVAWRPA